MLSICTKDLFGRFYIKKQHYNKREQYYQTLDIVNDLLIDGRFNNLTTGWYIHNADGVRLSYFIDRKNNPNNIVDYCENWFLTKGLDVYEELEYPHQKKLVLPYANENKEEEFRNYLFFSTLISLDLLEKDIRNYTRIFFGVLRQTLDFPALFKYTLRKYFDKYSSIFDLLVSTEKDEFMERIIFHQANKTSWFHPMMNTIFSCDKDDGEIWLKALKEIGLKL